MGQETPSLIGQHCRAAWPAALPIQLDAESLLERQKTAPQALLGDPENLRRGTNLSLPRQFDEGANLIGAQLGQYIGHSPRIHKYFSY